MQPGSKKLSSGRMLLYAMTGFGIGCIDFIVAVYLLKYYTDHASRMRYDEYLRLGYGIGSGAVESAHKQVVHARLRQAGMRWSEQGARRLLALRLLLLNNEWNLLDRLRMVSLAA